MRTLYLKAWPEPFEAMLAGDKRFEFRRNDRDFAVGDILGIHEWNPETERYTGRTIVRRVTYVLREGQFGVPKGYAVLSLENA